MKRIECVDYNDKGNNSKQANGTSKNLMTLLTIIVLLIGIYMITDNLKNTSATIETGGAPIPTGTKTPETPINTQYSSQGNYYSVFTNTQNVTDNFGTTYTSAYVANVGINSSAKKLTYKLNESYKSLKGTIYLSEANKDNINYFKVSIYNENGECIYQSSAIDDKNLGPITIDCNISACSMITIELEGCTTHCTSISVIMPDEGFVFT